ncbi:HAD-like domain-containing protein [Apiospora saccharicola]|uniref:HAD-like domain-containing protein n=1 Tax=Apiospora saccharicola TaxID=335842 RepID=A0ABR1UKC5_9PEZI
MISLVAFDLDRTLVRSKQQPLPIEVVAAINFLLRVAHVALICHGDWEEVEPRVGAQLASDIPDLAKLWILPAGGTRIYGHRLAEEDGRFEYENRWNLWSDEEVTTMVSTLDAALAAKGLAPDPSQIRGRRVEYCGSYLKLHVLGREADEATKDAWDPDDRKRKQLNAEMRLYLHGDGDGMRPEFEIRVGYGDTLDITRDDGLQRFACYHHLEDITGIPCSEMLWVGHRDDKPGKEQCMVLKSEHHTYVENLGEAVATIRAITACLS